jgi:hypothetical protein
MDRDEAIKLLKGGKDGIAEWNRRRGDSVVPPELRGAIFFCGKLSGPNLSDANLVGADLSGANLNGANLSRATLIGANLSGASLIHANLNGASLIKAQLIFADLLGATLLGAKLRGANLREANLRAFHLSMADLRGANLSGANLGGATLTLVTLARADLTNATCGNTIFTEVDLSGVKGIDSIIHGGPSWISVDMLFRFGEKIPEAFLRGCGVKEALISYLPNIIASMSPIQFYSCFISYSSKNHDLAERLHADLEAKGVRCWIDRKDLKIGQKIRVSIDESIRMHDKLLLVLSKTSVQSDWVEKEVESAMERERREKRLVLFPIRVDDAVMKIENGWPADIRRSRHIGDFRRWNEHDDYQQSFARLLRDLMSEKAAEKITKSIHRRKRDTSA